LKTAPCVFKNNYEPELKSDLSVFIFFRKAAAGGQYNKKPQCWLTLRLFNLVKKKILTPRDTEKNTEENKIFQ